MVDNIKIIKINTEESLDGGRRIKSRHGGGGGGGRTVAGEPGVLGRRVVVEVGE